MFGKSEERGYAEIIQLQVVSGCRAACAGASGAQVFGVGHQTGT